MIRRPRMPRFYGWRIVGAGGLIQMLHSGLLMQAFGNYSVILRQEFGWSATMLAAAFSMTRAGNFVSISASVRWRRCPTYPVWR